MTYPVICFAVKKIDIGDTYNVDLNLIRVVFMNRNFKFQR